jgi:hypothetical protein
MWRPSPQVSRLIAEHDRLVPVIGAGLSRAAGLPAGAELAHWLAHQHGDGSLADVENCLWVADAITEGRRDAVARLQHAVSDYLDLASWTFDLTPAHLALVQARSGVVATFNYDLLLEEAARRQGMTYASLTLHDVDDLADVLHGQAKAELAILHLHGRVGAPETIVLDSVSYRDHINSGAVRSILTALFMTHTVAFLGTALDEPYLLAALQSWTDASPRHVLFTDEASAAAMTGGRAAVSTPRFGVVISEFPTGEWDQVDVIAEALAGGTAPAPRPEPTDAEHVVAFRAGPGGLGPLVDFTAVGPNGIRLHDAALIDTGAQASAFPLHFMDRLGIRRQDCRAQIIETAGGRSTSYVGPTVKVSMLGDSFDLQPVFADTPICLFGRGDVLQRYRVTVDHGEMTITLRRAGGDL